MIAMALKAYDRRNTLSAKLKRNKHKIFAVFVCLIFFIVLNLQNTKKQRYEIAEAKLEDVTMTIELPGEVESSISVDVKPRVSGIIKSINFKDGQNVQMGDTLFIIDDTTIKSDLEKAKAELDVANAHPATPKEQYAIIDALTAKVKLYKLQLEYCIITSPIAGITGKTTLQIGDLIEQNQDQVLVTIYKPAPVTVKLYIPPEYQELVQKHYFSDKIIARIDELPITSFIKKLNKEVATANFENNDNSLWPGQMVNVKLELFTQKNALTIPSKAVWTEQNKHYVKLANSSKKEVKVAFISNNVAVINYGLMPGDKVVSGIIHD